MIISKVTFARFRNFKYETTLEFSKDPKKINVVYGLNGEGKTTIHQLFRWLFYGRCNFDPARSADKTAREWDLYNARIAKDLQEGQKTSVEASCEFSHLGTAYSLTRVAYYKKDHGSMVFDGEKLDLLKKTPDRRYISVAEPQNVIDEILPSVFSKYFFFDGERMVNDLRAGKASATNELANAVYYLFDLKEYNDAIRDIGDENKTTTVIGKLDSTVDDSDDNKKDLTLYQWKKVNCNKNVEELEVKLESLNEQYNNHLDEISRLSEIIGSSKGSSDLEKERKRLEDTNRAFRDDLKKCKQDFARQIYSIYPRVIVANKSLSVKDEILQVIEHSSDYVPGLTRQIVENLLERDKCICGNPLNQKERETLSKLFNLLPPKSYQSLYHDFLDLCKRDADAYLEQSETADDILSNYSSKIEQIDKNTIRIEEIDLSMKQYSDIDSFIDKRIEEEQERDKCKRAIDETREQKKEYELYATAYEKRINALRATQASYAITKENIEIMKQVRQYLQLVLSKKLTDCRQTLQSNIKELIGYILTSNRKVEVSENFMLTVTNLLGGNYQNEGTFAVVSFSFILGLLKTLKKYNTKDAQKQYALLLDAPFSKLDIVHKPRVVNKLLEYGDQIILLSKDNLNDYLPEDNTGTVYTLESIAPDQTVTSARKASPKEVEYYFSDEHVMEIEKRKTNHLGGQN